MSLLSEPHERRPSGSDGERGPSGPSERGVLSDLLHARAYDADGRDLGLVKDVRLVQDGPLTAGFDHRLRLDGLVVGGRLLGVRLGFMRHEITGPWLIAALFRRLERRCRYYLWDDVESWEPGVVRLRPGARGRSSRDGGTVEITAM